MTTPDTAPEPQAAPEQAEQTMFVDAPEMLLAEKDAEISELKDRLLRQAAETENMRRRLEREKDDASVYALTKFARDLLSVADNLGRAVQGVPESARADSAIANLITGVELTERELLSVFERFSISKIDAHGARFDANLHQAMAEVEHAEAAPGTVLQVYQTGYRIKDRLLRPAMVVVAKAPAAPSDASRVDTTA
jgi:molecular chaperone GrpE